MKKKIIAIAAIGSLVLLTAAYSIFSTEKNQVNSLMLENIEALAQSEGGGGGCYGPKEHVFLSGYVCRCRNTVSCQDNKGCN
mgnify:CR=1 FL=1